jgi:hypothetical protein
MPTSIVCTTIDRLKDTIVSPKNFVLVTDSKDPNHTFGLKMWDDGFHWIQLVSESTNTGGTSSGSTNSGSTTSGETNSSAPTTSETEVTDNGN